jgi:hypothetical protein
MSILLVRVEFAPDEQNNECEYDTNDEKHCALLVILSLIAGDEKMDAI